MTQGLMDFDFLQELDCFKKNENSNQNIAMVTLFFCFGFVRDNLGTTLTAYCFPVASDDT